MASKSTTGGLAASIAAANAAIETKRARIAELQGHLSFLETANVSFDEVERRVDRAIASAQGRGLPTQNGLRSRREGDWEREFNTSAAGHSGTAGGPRIDARPFDFFAILAPDALRTALLSGYLTGSVTEPDRAAEMAKAEAELFESECHEEIMCRGFDAVMGRGGDFPRREDAQPAILCAPDHELESACVS